VDHFETVRLTKSGERIHVSITVSPIRDEAGNVTGAAKIARDITQQKKAEEALRTTERLAAVGRLAATVAHEINNPLAAVTNLIYLSKQNAVRDEVRGLLSNAEEELERISHLTKQTLGFYRESKTPTAIRLGSIVESTISVFASRARNKGVSVRSEIKQNPEIYAVPGELRQLIGNLLSNSIDAVEEGGQVRVRVSATSKNGLFSKVIRLTVADSGSGIPDEIRERIFEPFFTTKKDVGTGLGLWICKSIVDRYCGSIRIWSRTTEGKSGTIVSVVLPVSGQEQAVTGALRKAV
jgi:signal transduction histidine kinase